MTDFANIKVANSTDANRVTTERLSRDAEVEARQVAEQFEALFLAQLTASLGPSEERGEDDPFRSDAGDMYQRMYGEQIAGAMAQSGGIGLTDIIMGQLRDQRGAAEAGAAGGAGDAAPRHFSLDARKAFAMARALRTENAVTSSSAAATGGESARESTRESTIREILETTRPRRVNSPAAAHSPVSSAAAHHEHREDSTAMRMPLAGRVSSAFGGRRDPVTGARRFHGGVDIAAPAGSPIGAVAAGRVVFAGRQGGYGNTVIVEHADGRQSRYAHAARLLVKEGDAVDSGQTIATVGSTGRSTGPHLHLEVTENGRRVDPLRSLGERGKSGRINDLSAVRR